MAILFRSLFLASLVLAIAGQPNTGSQQFIVTQQSQSFFYCPQGWIEFAKFMRCFKFFRAQTLSWNDAEQMCAIDGAHLAGAETLEEHRFLAQQLSASDPQRSNKWYTSGRLVGQKWSWRSDGTLMAFNEGWADGFPGFDLAGNRIVYAYSAGEWQWEVASGDVARPFVCEISYRDISNILDRPRRPDFGYFNIFDVRFIPMGPIMKIQPIDTMYNVDPVRRDTINPYVSITCLAHGYPPPRYSWYRLGAKIYFTDDDLLNPTNNSRLIQRDGTLTVFKPLEEDFGVYQCKAYNEYGGILSNQVAIRKAFLDDFDLLPRTKIVTNENLGVVVNCRPPNHYPEVTFKWYKEDIRQEVTQNRDRFISQNGNMYFSKVTLADGGNYLCAAIAPLSQYGTLPQKFSPKTAIEIRQAGGQERLPNIWSEFPRVFPSSPSAGSNVTIECIAQGDPTPTFSWKRFQRSVQTDIPKRAVFENYGRVLRINAVTAEDGGYYRCIASNKIGASERDVLLTVNVDPYFIRPLENRFVDRNAKVEWICDAAASTDVEFFWFKNGKQINFDERDTKPKLQILDPPKRNRLVINGATEDDNGMYQCGARSILSSVIRYSSAQLKIFEFMPTFAKTPMMPYKVGVIGHSVTMECAPEGAPQPDIRWTKDELPLSGGGRIEVLSNKNLRIRDLQQSDQGRYTCTATNQLGSDTNVTVLAVRYGSTLRESPQPREEVRYNESYVLKCEVQGDNFAQRLDITYLWKFNGYPIDPLKFGNLDQDIMQRPGYLRISPALYNSTGEYTCIARTPVDEITNSGKLSVVGPPGPVAGIQCITMEQRNITMQWTIGDRHGADIVEYVVEYRTEFDPLAQFEVLEIVNALAPQPQGGSRKSTGIHVAKVGQLSAYTAYQFRVRARNRYGLGEASESSSYCVTLPDVPEVNVQNVGGGGGKVGDLVIKWDPIPKKFANGGRLEYVVYWREDGDLRDPEKRIVSGGRSHYVVLVPGKIYTKYWVKVRAQNEMGLGPDMDLLMIRSAEGIPDLMVASPKVIPYNATALKITWTAVDENDEQKLKGTLGGYIIHYWRYRTQTERDFLRVKIPGQTNHGMVVGLDPETEYAATVRVYNSAGDGPESQEQYHRTFRKPSQKAPEYVDVVKSKQGRFVAEVKWRGVSSQPDEESVSGYWIRIWQPYQDFRESKIYTAGPMDTKVTIKGLDSEQIYMVRVQAVSRGGEGKHSSPLIRFKFNKAGDILYNRQPDTSYWNWNSASQSRHSHLLFICFFIALLFV